MLFSFLYYNVRKCNPTDSKSIILIEKPVFPEGFTSLIVSLLSKNGHKKFNTSLSNDQLS